MTDYSELVKALRIHTSADIECDECAYYDDCYIHGPGEKMIADAADAIEALKAEVERLKDANDELREAQTYIDNYGDKWMTSAKDVPTSAYNHGYMDGKNEAEQAQLPKRGEIVRCRECRWGHLCVTGQHLGLDGFCSKGEREVQDDKA